MNCLYMATRRDEHIECLLTLVIRRMGRKKGKGERGDKVRKGLVRGWVIWSSRWVNLVTATYPAPSEFRNKSRVPSRNKLDNLPASRQTQAYRDYRFVFYSRPCRWEEFPIADKLHSQPKIIGTPGIDSRRKRLYRDLYDAKVFPDSIHPMLKK